MNQNNLFPKQKSAPRPRRIVRIKLGSIASKTLDEVGLPAFGVLGAERSQDDASAWILYLAEPKHPAALEAAIEIMKTAAELENKTLV